MKFWSRLGLDIRSEHPGCGPRCLEPNSAPIDDRDLLNAVVAELAGDTQPDHTTADDKNFGIHFVRKYRVYIQKHGCKGVKGNVSTIGAACLSFSCTGRYRSRKRAVRRQEEMAS